MNARNRLLLGLIGNRNLDTEEETPPPVQEAQEDSTMGVMTAPEPEIKTPQQEFKEIVELANKKVGGQKKKKAHKNKVVDKLLEFMEEQYQPISIDEADIF